MIVDDDDGTRPASLETQARYDLIDGVSSGVPVSAATRVVLLGSIASNKYVEALTPAFGNRLHFPASFIGRGDMSRGGLLLSSAAAGVELDYVRLDAATTRRGTRPPKLGPLTGRR